MKMRLLFIFLLCFYAIECKTQSLENLLKTQYASLHFRISHYDTGQYNLLVHQTEAPLASDGWKGQVKQALWEVTYEAKEVPGIPEAQDIIISFRCVEGQAVSASVSATLVFAAWQKENYVLMPGAAYNGNRYPYRRIRYSPKLLDPRDIGPDVGTILSDVPKLNHEDGFSRIQARTGDMATPGIGFFSPSQKRGFWLLTHQGTPLGDSGISIAENKDRSQASISLTAPVVRELYKYRITDSRHPSDDSPANFNTGDEVELKMRIFSFPAEEIQDLYDYFANIRKSLVNNGQLKTVLPFSSAFAVQEQKFNSYNWVEDYGYYSVGPRDMFLQDWQIGWTGGMISTYPLLWEGNELTKANVLRNFDWVFADGISPSGLFWDSGEKGYLWYGGDIRKPHTANWHLIRKSGDAIFYITKQLMLMEKLQIPVKDAWKKGTRGSADALVKIWETQGQFGQFVDNRTGEVQVGGSTSGAMIPGGLAIAARYFDEPAYLAVAEAAAQYYYENFVRIGLSTGGPGDAMQNPDSESAFALVESFAVLYEETGNEKYLKMAEDAAKQFATWVISYNYKFPAQSLFGKEDMFSLGAVFANAQNKHGAPGICTHSGLGLLKIFRATGDTFYLDLLRDITHNIPQYLAHPEKPIAGAETGLICERVSTTDWLEGIGEISYLSTWAETALMLTYIEIPGLYVQPDRGVFACLDNITATLKADTKQKMVLSVNNPTRLPAKVKVLAENAAQRAKPLGQNALWQAQVLTLQPGETKELSFPKK